MHEKPVSMVAGDNVIEKINVDLGIQADLRTGLPEESYKV